ncbi:MAG: adenylyltransferase/cytidyltransferase family protein [Lachnospiraceae bacterium]|nr:adenylyltransferase/cytidyltransferase family protein [Lachnospiraceae bacterium]
MLYTEYDKLTIKKLKNEVSCLSFDELGKILEECPANVIYCELDGKLYGIISTGDVARASDHGKNVVNINRKFTSVKSNEYMKVRQIFKEKERINAVPVIDENGRLLGDYTRWDDLLMLERLNLFDEYTYFTDFLRRGENNYIALVKPHDAFDEKLSLMKKWKSKLDRLGVRVKVIDRMSVPQYIDKVNLVLFTDEDEWRGSITLIEKIHHKKLIDDKLYTYKGAWRKARKEIEDKTLDECLEYIRKKGAHILNIHFSDNGSEYYDRLVRNEIHQKYVNEDVPPSNWLPLSAMEDFFEELYTEEYANAVSWPPFKVEKFNEITRIKDISSKYHNAKNGERLTVGSPLKYDRTIYFYGSCFIRGHYVEDKHTVESFLQVKCNSEGNCCRVVNFGSVDIQENTVQRILSTPIKKDDIIVTYLNNREIPCVDNLNLTSALEKNGAPAKWFVNVIQHGNHKVNEICADAIYEAIRPLLETPNLSGDLIDMENKSVVDTYFNCYFNHFNSSLYGKIGSIVMNCNPFTNGHRYLIEESLKYVDYLIIFVVEENKSVFTFDERLVLVKAGVSDLQNVMVVPSGKFILSQITFPEYFLKVEDEDLIKNVEYDISLFAERIAPRLNITYRFVGEEPQDAVTNEYNQAMKRILPRKGINVIEIPRKENDNDIISASLVRKYLEDDDRTNLKELIPKSTWKILFG